MAAAMVRASGRHRRVGVRPAHFPAPRISSAGSLLLRDSRFVPGTRPPPAAEPRRRRGDRLPPDAGRPRGAAVVARNLFFHSPSSSPSSHLALPAWLAVPIPFAPQHFQLRSLPIWWLLPASLLFGRIVNLGLFVAITAGMNFQPPPLLVSAVPYLSP